ncbi:MAG: DUF1570 domain-containing protein, partial [Planctomycetes bacterium]|nr:DUF1570 domain-containing protein [Planctomycetota bacterium]
FTGTTFGVLCHEGTHYFQGLVLQDFDNIPMWLIEGLAVYFGDGSAFDAQKRKITVGLIPRDRLAHIQEKMLLARHTPVKKLVSMTRRDGFNGSHYADAWALIYFLVKSGKKGELLLMEYWAKGLKARLEKKDFLDLADKHFGGVEALEKQYVAYTLKLDMPPAGKVLGDYFVSDTFQFDYKAPGEDWQFFEDRDDKKLLVGMLAPSGKGEIRVYYKNNELWLKPDKYMEGYLRTVPQFKDLKRDQVKSGKLQWEKLTYLDDGSDPPAMTIVMSEEEGIPRVEVIKAKKDDKAKKAPSDVVRYLLIQDDGVVEVECSAPQGQGAQLAEVFDVAHESFTMTFTRRW